MKKRRSLIGLIILGLALLPNILKCNNIQVNYMKEEKSRRLNSNIPLYVNLTFEDYDVDYINTISIYLTEPTQTIDIVSGYTNTYSIPIGNDYVNSTSYVNISLANNEDMIMYYVLERFDNNGNRLGNYNGGTLISGPLTETTYSISTSYGLMRGVVNDGLASGYFDSTMKVTQEHIKNVNNNLLNDFILLDSLKNKIDDLISTISSLEQQRLDLVNQNHNLQRSLENLYNQYNELYNNYQTQSEDLATLQQQKINLEMTISQLNDEVYTLSNELQKVKSELAQNVPKNIIDWIKIFSKGFIDIFNIEMLPNFKVGYLIVAPILIGIISLFIKLIRGA